MPIVYAICSFLSYFFYRQALYLQLVRDCYEAIVIAEFFFLLLSYLSNPPPTADDPIPTPYATKAERDAQLRESVKDLHLEKWMWPLGWLKWRPAGGGPGEGEVRTPFSLLDPLVGLLAEPALTRCPSRLSCGGCVRQLANMSSCARSRRSHPS